MDVFAAVVFVRRSARHHENDLPYRTAFERRDGSPKRAWRKGRGRQVRGVKERLRWVRKHAFSHELNLLRAQPNDWRPGAASAPAKVRRRGFRRGHERVVLSAPVREGVVALYHHRRFTVRGNGPARESRRRAETERSWLPVAQRAVLERSRTRVHPVPGSFPATPDEHGGMPRCRHRVVIAAARCWKADLESRSPSAESTGVAGGGRPVPDHPRLLAADCTNWSPWRPEVSPRKWESNKSGYDHC